MFMAAAFAFALVLTVITFTVLRRVVINPLQRAAQRIARIASGDLTVADEAAGRSEIGRLSSDLQAMQHSLVTTVSTVRQALKRSIVVPAKSPPVIPIFPPVPSSRRRRLKRRQPAWSN